MKAPRFTRLLGTAIVFAAGVAIGAQENRTRRIPQFENDEVKVWKSIVMPNQPLGMHRHDHPRVIVPLAGGTMKILQQSGESQSHAWETGKAYWLPAEPPGKLHDDINAGDKPIELIVVELKRSM